MVVERLRAEGRLVQPFGLDHGPHGAVEDQDPPAEQSLKLFTFRHGGSPGSDEKTTLRIAVYAAARTPLPLDSPGGGGRFEPGTARPSRPVKFLRQPWSGVFDSPAADCYARGTFSPGKRVRAQANASHFLLNSILLELWAPDRSRPAGAGR